MLEASSQQQVAQGVANVNEQVALLEKVATPHRDVLGHKAKIAEH